MYPSTGILVTAMILLLVLAWHLRFTLHSRNRTLVVIGWLLLIQSSQVVVPAIYGLIYDHPEAQSLGIGPGTLFLVYALEPASLLCWLVGFYWVGSSVCKSYRISGSFLPAIATERVLSILPIISLVTLLIDLGTGLPLYGDVNRDLSVADMAQQSRIIHGGLMMPETVFTALKSLFQMPGLIASAVIVTRQDKSRWAAGPAWLLIAVYVLVGFLTGLRGVGVGVATLLLICGYLQGTKTGRPIAAVLLVSVAVLAGPMNRFRSDMSRIRGGSAVEDTGVRFKALRESVEYAPVDPGARVNDFWHTLGGRFSDPIFSSGLVRSAWEDGPVMLRPSLYSLMTLVPRFLWAEKPVAGSFDGSVSGMAIYAARDLTTGSHDSVCVGFTASAHDFWELGVLGVVLLGTLSGLLARVVVSFTINRGPLGLIFWVMSLKPLEFLPRLWFAGVVQVGIQNVIVPILLLWIAGKFLQQAPRKHLRHAVQNKNRLATGTREHLFP